MFKCIFRDFIMTYAKSRGTTGQTGFLLLSLFCKRKNVHFFSSHLILLTTDLRIQREEVGKTTTGLNNISSFISSSRDNVYYFIFVFIYMILLVASV